MKRIILNMILAAAAIGSTLGAAADENRSVKRFVQDAEACGVEVRNVLMQRSGDVMKVAMELQLNDFALNAGRVAVFAPMIAKGADTLRLQPVGLYGRTRWFQYLRAGEKPAGGDGEVSIRWSERPAQYSISENVDYAEWMNGAELLLERCDYGCCHSLVDEMLDPLMGYREVYFTPVYRYVHPEADAVKLRELSGRAYIDFPVNRTEIYPEYRKNPIELQKIIATIDSVRNDSDVTVREITIKGYASPESPWSNNTRLAKGRTATLKQYVQNLYHFPEDFIKTDYEPEDWAGLREYVVTSGLTHRDEILALIDDPTLEPDPKEYKIKTTYPEEYKFLLATVYPGLRHSDYKIEYTIRQFSDVKDIARLLRTAPQKLSLEEMFLLAQSLEPGSDEYNDVFEIAVRMYPDDKTANLNAAVSAMQHGDLRRAEEYLSKAGNSAEAVYAAGMLKGLQGDYQGALELVRKASLADTGDVEKNLEEVIEFN